MGRARRPRTTPVSLASLALGTFRSNNLPRSPQPALVEQMAQALCMSQLNQSAYPSIHPSIHPSIRPFLQRLRPSVRALPDVDMGETGRFHKLIFHWLRLRRVRAATKVSGQFSGIHQIAPVEKKKVSPRRPIAPFQPGLASSGFCFACPEREMDSEAISA